MPLKEFSRLRPVFVTLALYCFCHVALAEDIVSGEFELLDHEGQSVTEHSYDGKLRLLFFGFTQCPDVCPTTLFVVGRVMTLLGDDASQVQPIFISVDRKNDTPERLASYVSAFHPSLVGLTGTEQQLDAAARAFNVTYGIEKARPGDSGRDSIYHSAYLFLMDRQGRFIDLFGYGSKAEVIAARLREYL